MAKGSGPGKRRPRAGGRPVTIKDLAAELGLSITTISRALNGYPDVGEKTRARIVELARKRGYRANRSATRLVSQRTHALGWIRNDDEGIFVDPHFVEVFAGVLRSSRKHGYDLMVSAAADPAQLDAYARYVADRSVDGFIIDLPQPRDTRIGYLLEAGVPFVVHGRDEAHAGYGWVDIDNRGIFRTLIEVLLDSGHTNIAFINGDERYAFAVDRRAGVNDALSGRGLPPGTVTVLNTKHPMTHASTQLTEQVVDECRSTAILYSSAWMAVEGYSALTRRGIAPGRDITIATMDDELRHLDLEPYAGIFNIVHSSLREAGHALVDELFRQCERGEAPRGTMIGAYYSIRPGLDASAVPEGWLLPQPEAAAE